MVSNCGFIVRHLKQQSISTLGNLVLQQHWLGKLTCFFSDCRLSNINDAAELFPPSHILGTLKRPSFAIRVAASIVLWYCLDQIGGHEEWRTRKWIPSSGVAQGCPRWASTMDRLMESPMPSSGPKVLVDTFVQWFTHLASGLITHEFKEQLGRRWLNESASTWNRS